jgi:cytoskeletal protein CcmA (bactofilin family)
MWNRKKEDDFAPKPIAGPPAPSELAKEGIPMSTLPGRSSSTASEPHYEPAARTAALGKSVIVKGQIYSREDLTIDGEVEGTVELQEHRLTVGPNGKVRASIKARELVVLGTIHGDVETTDKIDIRKEAKLVGDIKTARIVIEDGAYFKGNIDIVRAEAARPAAAPASKPASSSSPSTASATPAPKPAASVGTPSASASASGPALAAGVGETKR